MANKSLLGIGIVVLIAGLTGIYFIANSSQSNEEKISVIRIGDLAPGGLQTTLWKEKGWMDEEFAKDGIKVEYVRFTGGGSEAAYALASGSLEFTTGAAATPSLLSASSGADIKMIALSSFNRFSTTSITVRNDSTIKSVKDLKGKKVAYLKGTMRHSFLAKALKTAGLSIKDVESLNLNFDASGPALIRGDIDALVEGETTVYPLVSKGVARDIASAKDHPDWSTPTVLMVRGDFARKHPDIVKRFLKIDLKTAQWADEHFDETIKIYANATKRSEVAYRDQYPKNRFYLDPIITDEAIQSLKDFEVFMRENGLLEGKVDFTSWVDKSYIDSVIAEINKK